MCEISKGEQLNRATLSERGRIPVYNGGTSPSGYAKESNTDAESIIISEGGNSCGYVNFVHTPFWRGGHCYLLKTDIDKALLYCILKANEPKIMSLRVGTGLPNIQRKRLNSFEFNLPTSKVQQQHIILAFTSIDANIAALQSLITKYEAIKKATVNLLLEPKAGWKRMKLDEICMCLDNYRKPVNEVERAGMQGDIPYCGANGIVDYVNDFTIDDSIILIAEDGGYFDQYESRPIAYRMSGKAWINNHAHILKAKSDYCQAFIFYSLEHKDITPFITSGTRAKLTKGELSNIEIDTPSSFQEQRKIAEQITAIDNVLAAYKAQLEKARQLKAGMMSYFFG